MLSSRSLKYLVLAGALLAAGCDRQSEGESQPQASQSPSQPGDAAPDKLDRSHKGAPIPAATLVDDKGETLDLASFKGKPLLINLWATWCAPCIAEMPTLAALAATQDRVTVLPISQDMGQIDKVVDILRRRKLDLIEPWVDDKGDLGFKYGGNLPVTVLFDSEGKEVWRYTGGMDWASAKAAKLMAEAE